MKKLYIESLGCPKNLTDSELILYTFKKKGYKIVSDFNQADIIIVNTCGFIKKAKEESLEYILHYAGLGKKKIIVTGCLVNLYKEELQKQIPEVKFFYSIDEFFKTHVGSDYDHRLDYSGFQELTPLSYTYIKVSDGCSKNCSYCTIPLIKGKQFSRPIDNIMIEIKKKAEYGFKEFDLIAQDLLQFGLREKRESLFGLLDRIEQLPYDIRVRLLYLYPDKKLIELARKIRDSEKIINYLDIPVQHSSEKILKAMNRPFDSRFYFDLFEQIKKIDEFTIRSTFIAGFPGEGEDDFQNLKEFIKVTEFNWAGFFSYSDEENTVSSRLPEKIEEKKIKERLGDLTNLQGRITSKWLNTRLEKTYDVVVDELVPSDGYILCRSDHEAPDIDGSIIIKFKDNIKAGDRIKVRIKKSLDYDLEGEIYE
ncbi:MAG: 30S ribosomal protein S12 methylthiotransferase RimO [Spirochaetes bacterium]|nr:30S ribosomal protein S12 methylthiotransferase RimO [Spirochaetota bacterium]